MNKVLISVRVGRIEESLTDAIVSAANSNYLTGGGGTSGAIEKLAGPAYTKRLQDKRCPVGQARISDAGDLFARYVIHTTVPLYPGSSDGDTKIKFQKAVTATVHLAEAAMVSSLSIPILGAGHFGWDTARAVRFLINAITGIQYTNAGFDLFPITIVAFTEEDAIIVIKELAKT